MPRLSVALGISFGCFYLTVRNLPMYNSPRFLSLQERSFCLFVGFLAFSVLFVEC